MAYSVSPLPYPLLPLLASNQVGVSWVSSRGAVGGVTFTRPTRSHHFGASPERKIVARTYSVDTTVSPSSLLARARRAASENGATLLGDEGSGRFAHEM